MPAAAILPSRVAADASASRKEGVAMLQIFAIAVMVFPSDTVFKPVGAAGYLASLFGMFMFAVFTASVLLGIHDAGRHPHPIRAVLAVFWVSLLASYILMDRGELTSIELATADRTLMQGALITGVALVAAEWLRSLDDMMRVLRVLCWGAAFCAFVAICQFWISFDFAQYLREIPGFTINHDNPAIVARGALNRVQGTAINPIEMGVVMGMLIPLAICLGLYDKDKSPFKRWAPLILIILGVATSVSRSAVISVLIAFAVMVVLMPPVPRLGALIALPIAVAGIFMTAHGLIGTLTEFFAGASHDPSVQFRTHDYPVAEAVWQAAPWFGHGPGSWLPADSLNIFDNQYLGAAVMEGAVGVIALLVFLVTPGIVALVVRRRSGNPDVRLLCGALAAASLVTPVCSATFDSMAFPMFVNVYALVIGLIGACFRLVSAEREPAREVRPRVALARTHFQFPRPLVLRSWRADA